MSGIKIIKKLNNNQYIVEIDESQTKAPRHIKVMHDFVEIEGNIYPTEEHGGRQYSLDYETPYFRDSIQIPIRDVFNFILPHLNNHKYLQEEHFKTRPALNEGEQPYEPYCYHQSIYSYYTEGKKKMVAIRMKGESEFNHVTYEFFLKHIKPNL